MRDVSVTLSETNGMVFDKQMWDLQSDTEKKPNGVYSSPYF